MTINVAVLTAEALVFGCDSIASTTEYLLDPFGRDMKPQADGSMTVAFTFNDLVPTVTNSWGGVTKMCELSSWPPVAAVTSGLAKLNGLTMSSLAREFVATRKERGVPASDLTVEQIARDFLAFIRERYDEQYKDSALPEQIREGPMFLVGGYGSRDHFSSLFRLHVQYNQIWPAYGHGEFGVAWGGQSDAVERVLRGYDSAIRERVEKACVTQMNDYREAAAAKIAESLQGLIAKLGADKLDGVTFDLPELPELRLPWEAGQLKIQFGNLPLQDAIDLAAFLVNQQSGRAKFASGVATVGGRTHIGVITKHGGFKAIDEPELRHLNIGFVS